MCEPGLTFLSPTLPALWPWTSRFEQHQRYISVVLKLFRLWLLAAAQKGPYQVSVTSSQCYRSKWLRMGRHPPTQPERTDWVQNCQQLDAASHKIHFKEKSERLGLLCCSALDFPLWEDSSWVWGGSAGKAAETLLETSWNAHVRAFP